MTTNTYVPNPVSPRVLGHHWSAKADRLQSATGVLMGVFLLFHLHFESSILLGKDAFYHVVHFLEGSIFSDDGKGFPVITQIISVFMLLVFVIHAIFALRRFPAQLGQWRALKSSLNTIRHGDTRMWFFQLITGAALFFLVPVHLFEMIQAPAIGPNMSAERVYHDNTWVLYALLLPAVVVHAVFGLYRVAVKWGICAKREQLRRFAHYLMIYLMVLGIASLMCYLLIGSELTLPVTPYSPS